RAATGVLGDVLPVRLALGGDGGRRAVGAGSLPHCRRRAGGVELLSARPLTRGCPRAHAADAGDRAADAAGEGRARGAPGPPPPSLPGTDRAGKAARESRLLLTAGDRPGAR